jgi:spartin
MGGGDSPSDPAVPTHDFWLVLHVGSTFEMPLIPETYLIPSAASDSISYTIPSPHVPNAFLLIELPKPATAADMEESRPDMQDEPEVVGRHRRIGR